MTSLHHDDVIRPPSANDDDVIRPPSAISTSSSSSDSSLDVADKAADDAAAQESTHLQQRRLYKADESPPLLLTILFGFQQVMVSVSVLVSIPFLIADEVCPGRDLNDLRVRLISGTFVVCGLATIIQTSLGMRLALLQGVAFAYLPSVRAFMTLPEYKCTATEVDIVPVEEYEGKMALIQGTLMASSCITILIGATGLVGRMTKYISPITVTTLLIMMMYSSVPLVVERMEKHWITLVTLAALFVTILYLGRALIPVPVYMKGRFQLYRVNILGQFPYLTAIIFSWTLCWLMTVTNVLPVGSEARTDKNATVQAIQHSPWIRIPFPGEFGHPRFNIGLFVAYLVSAQTTLFEAVGNYHAVARVSEERPPPSHAINRGIMAEGLGCFISGLVGPGVGITTHAENVGVIGITRVASRVTMLFGGCTLLLFGIFTKLGALLSAIPDPLVGVVLATSMGMVGGMAISNVRVVDLTLTRNTAILGFSIMMGMCVPHFYMRHSEEIRTGTDTLDHVLKVLLNLPMFIGPFTACVLDNTVGGATRTQRGLRARGLVHDLPKGRVDVYSFPPAVMRVIDNVKILRYLPFIPKEKKVKVPKADVAEMDVKVVSGSTATPAATHVNEKDITAFN